MILPSILYARVNTSAIVSTGGVCKLSKEKIVATNADRGQCKQKGGARPGFHRHPGPAQRCLGAHLGDVERGPQVSPLVVCCALHCAIPSTSQWYDTVPLSSVSSNKLMARDYVEVWLDVRRAGAWGVVFGPPAVWVRGRHGEERPLPGTPQDGS